MGSSPGEDSEPGVSPGQVQAMTGSPVGTTSMGRDFSGMTPDEASKAMDVDQALSDAGYSSGYKGVSSKSGSVVDSKGNPVSSGAYNNAKGQAEANYDYRMAEEKAKADFEGRMYNGPPVDPNLVNMAKGNLTNRSFITNNPVAFTKQRGKLVMKCPTVGPLGSSYTALSNNPQYSMVVYQIISLGQLGLVLLVQQSCLALTLLQVNLMQKEWRATKMEPLAILTEVS